MTTRSGGSPSTATTCGPLAAAPAAAINRPPWALMISLAFGRYSLAYPSGSLTSIWPIRYAAGLVCPLRGQSCIEHPCFPPQSDGWSTNSLATALAPNGCAMEQAGILCQAPSCVQYKEILLSYAEMV